ncbi:MAG: hypothetical protein R3E21_08100 [Caenibius sp.]
MKTGISDPLRLFDLATDWTGQQLHERIGLCTSMLYVQGYLTGRQHQHIRNTLLADLDRAGELRAKGHGR